MPTFEIEQYELHAMTSRVEADTEAEAVKKLLDGEADAVDGSLEYLDVAESFGLRVDHNPELVDELRRIGVDVLEEIIPSIRNIEQVESDKCE